MNTEPQIEPVTDEDAHAATLGYLNDMTMAGILEQDRRRVAERQASEVERLRAENMALRIDLEFHTGEVKLLHAEVAAHRKHDVSRCDALMKAEAEVARLTAACAAKEGWIDATGAVEATCFSHCEVIGREPFGTYRDVGRVEVPKEWAGSRVLIIPKPKE